MSSVFDNIKTVGNVFLVVGILTVIGAIQFIMAGFGDMPEKYAEVLKNWKLFCIITGVGSIICAILYIVFAMKVYNGQLSAKIQVLANYVRVAGIITVIGALFGAAALIAGGVPIGASLISSAITILIGLIIVFISFKIDDGKQTTGDKIIWVLLTVAFIIKLVLEALSVVQNFSPLSISGIVLGVCGVIIALFMLAFLFDPEVKSEMNM